MPNFDISQENTEFGIRGQIRPAGIQKLQGHTFRRDDFWGPEIVPPERVALRVLKLCRYSGGANYFPAGRFSDHNNRPAGTCGLAVFEFRREEFGSECQILIFLKKIRNLASGAKFVPQEFKNCKATRSGGRFLGPRNRPAGK